MLQRIVIEPKLPSRVTVRIREIVPVTCAWTSRQSTQQGGNSIIWRTIWNPQAALVYAGQFTRYVLKTFLCTPSMYDSVNTLMLAIILFHQFVSIRNVKFYSFLRY